MKEIEEGKYVSLIAELMNKSDAEIREMYNNREIEQ